MFLNFFQNDTSIIEKNNVLRPDTNVNILETSKTFETFMSYPKPYQYLDDMFK